MDQNKKAQHEIVLSQGSYCLGDTKKHMICESLRIFWGKRGIFLGECCQNEVSNTVYP